MTTGEQCAQPNGALGLFRLGSTRSLSRQRRFRSAEDLQMQSSMEDSIPDLSHSSAQSTSPVGDFPEQIHPSVLQKAALFLSGQQNMDSMDKPRVLANVSKTIQRTSSQINKTRLYHFFYLVAMPVYTLLGAVLFQWAEGENDDRLIREYQNRCRGDRLERLTEIQALCKSGDDCFHHMKHLLDEVEKCYRDWHAVNRTMTLSMNNFINANVYAFSVYTSIGYGNVAADTTLCRIFTVFYAVIGLSLFFGFVKEAGALFRVVFINTYNRLNATYKSWCRCKRNKDDVHTTIMARPKAINLEDGLIGGNSNHQPVILISEGDTRRAHFSRKYSSNSLFGKPAKLEINEQRRVFVAGVFVLFAYIFVVSFFFMLYTEFDYFTSVYFLFNSIALIGFGDVFPMDPYVILMFAPFIIIGVALFSMCYFILQEEISQKAMEASRRARKSISKYSHTIMQHSRTAWSRRNSPLLEGNAASPEGTDFERMRKRRQSAPAVTLTVPSRDRRTKSPDSNVFE